MRKKLSFLLVGVLFCSITAFAQSVVKGIVVDKDTKEPLIGVTVFSESEKKGTATELDGSFTLSLASLKGKLKFTYVGYKPVTLDAASNMGNIELEPDAFGLSDVIITSTIGVDRKTPVAMSTIDAEVITLKLGTKEFPELLKSTPSVYATKVGGGYGDSRVNVRGFDSPNVAVMINGVPMNDMEWGGLYWSNWAGLSDVTRIYQVQRGLGAVKISSPSVGGSINIVTKTTDAQKGGSVYYGMGNNGYNKVAFNVSTGLMDNGWAVTLLGSKTWSDGYIQSTDFEAYSYFLNVSKQLGDNQVLSFTAFGAPQWHNQRKDQLLIEEWAKLPEGERYQYNAGYGYDASGQYKTFNRNEYHKPQISLNHVWDINLKSNLSTALYLSLGSGGGYSGLAGKDENGATFNRNLAYGSTNGRVNQDYRANDGKVAGFGTYDFAKLMRQNADNPNGSLLAIQNAINNHVWVGLLSTYSNKITKEIELQGGIDFRYYKGIHKTKIEDLLGGSFLIDPQRAIDGKYKDNPEWVNEKLTIGDIVYRNYDGFVMQEGVFGQAEYSKDKLSAFVSGSFNVSNYWRVEKFAADNEKSKTTNKAGFGVKGGANYNFNQNHNAFVNIGYFSRTPFYSAGIYTNNQKSNAINPDGQNEKIFSMEAGYGFINRFMNAKLNIYRTQWMDKTMVYTLDKDRPQDGTVNLNGVNALHQGVELEVNVRPIEKLNLRAMAAFNNWKWDSNASGFAIDDKGQVVEKNGVTQEVLVNLKGIHVGNSPQTFVALGADYEIFKGMRIGLDYNYYGRNFADFKVSINKIGQNDFYQPWQIPDAHTWDMNFSYRFDILGLKTSLYTNIDNLFDAVWIADAQDGGVKSDDNDEKAKKAQVYYGFGRTWSVGLKVHF
ncbi:outer membrane cobalamin receptor [Dysgonomonas sp. PFB1-18]|uniref:TonB-dependent receptor n=1 Tax=unclassified Dysgonomonas TaxID=2630389 RepID=UPI0024753E3C|nr:MULTISPECIES: carboxypeptidase-like regulatory domain-containing protein [unclassified Dysgonomonas]MDH6309261.1 outer membrane cobalamin receptor [Dysgonomonas sp. PF1-14]MDH6338859.1 outer membrane cobalamin receptor [Dysgonomonas sp. PF1-16]MDH6380510.1 outer membrane cobalamin receptor [Dysgonomonas sp. PFB1-18]MDH6397687.1 outer membrane cobalamin receptor [Dysgonomonas sp. PF1-23]